MKKLLIAISLLCTISLSGQQKQTIADGVLYDYFTHDFLDSVKVTSLVTDKTIFSDTKGRFSIIVPPDYKDTLIITHPAYYTYIRLTKKPGFHIGLIPKVVEIDTFCFPSYEANRKIRGTIVERYMKKPVAGASIRLWDDKIIAWSDKHGKFSVGIPRNTKMLKISHPDFEPMIAEFKKHTPNLIIKMTKVNLQREDTIWSTWKNMVAVLPLELISGSVGLLYQHFFQVRHATGAYLSAYLFGWGTGPLGGGVAKYKGFKLAPYYRFYVWRNIKSGGFVQGKVIAGYFNFSKLYYEDGYGEYYESRQEEFWNLGFGVAWGWSVKLAGSRHGIFNITFGYQRFTLSVPPTTDSNHYGTLDVQSNWWYLVGPGSLFEIKLVFGGIF